MKNEKGEVITVIMVLMMVGMMVFGGMALMHGGREDQSDHAAHEMKGHHTGPGHALSGETATISTPADKERNE